MILQALTDYYHVLEREGKIAAPGWGPVKVSFALEIGNDGTLEQVVSIQTEQQKGKKTIVAPQIISLPAPVKRTVGVAANFLCDNSSYMLGIDNKGKPRRTRECFDACKALHEQLLEGVDSPAARAVLAFFRTWDPAQPREHPALSEQLDDLLAGGNLAFRTAEGYVHNDPAVRQAWEAHYSAAGDNPQGICLVTGEYGPVEAVHPSIKNVAGAQSSGAALVSFNAPAFCSYGKEQNLNAPTGKAAAFAYTTALNHLLADRDHVFRVGDATVVCWAKGGGDLYQSLFSYAAMGQTEPAYDENDLRNMVKQLCQGNSVTYQEEKLDPNMDFFVLGLSPNAARLSVRFFLHNTFGGFLRNVQAHQERLEIIQSVDNKFDTTPLWRLLYATVRSRAKYEPSSYKEARQNLEKYLPPELSGEVLRSILMNTRYPATLHNGVTLRIRAEHEITRSRAAVMKAYLLQNYCHLPIYSTLKEVLTVELNDSCNYQPYVLGCLFAVMEKIQLASADWKLNRTIKDSYFTSAATTPKNIYAKLFPLSEYHMKKLLRDKPGLANILGKEKSSLIGKLTTPIPSRFTPEETDCFYIGYYHQSNQKKEENEHV